MDATAVMHPAGRYVASLNGLRHPPRVNSAVVLAFLPPPSPPPHLKRA